MSVDSGLNSVWTLTTLTRLHLVNPVAGHMFSLWGIVLICMFRHWTSTSRPQQLNARAHCTLLIFCSLTDWTCLEPSPQAGRTKLRTRDGRLANSASPNLWYFEWLSCSTSRGGMCHPRLWSKARGRLFPPSMAFLCIWGHPSLTTPSHTRTHHE